MNANSTYSEISAVKIKIKHPLKAPLEKAYQNTLNAKTMAANVS